MKKIFILGLFIAITSINNGCKKDSEDSKTKTYKEEFVDVYNLGAKGWTLKDNSAPYQTAVWHQGFSGPDKYGMTSGFPAYSFKDDEDEYAYIGFTPYNGSYTISSWMISPVYEVKNGDKISFYTRAAEGTGFADRLQVRLNETDNTTDVGGTATSVGKFTMLLKDINENLAINGYPQTWTKYDITISGLTGAKQSRIAFRYFPDPSKSNGIGVDLFTFTSY